MTDDEMKIKMVTVQWHCRYYVGESKWHMAGDWVLEPDECNTDFDTQEDPEDLFEYLEDNISFSATCPICKAENNSSDDDPTIVLSDDVSFHWSDRFNHVVELRSTVRKKHA